MSDIAKQKILAYEYMISNEELIVEITNTSDNYVLTARMSLTENISGGKLKEQRTKQFKIGVDSTEKLPLSWGTGLYTIEIMKPTDEKGYYDLIDSIIVKVEKWDAEKAFTKTDYYSKELSEENLELLQELNGLVGTDKEITEKIYTWITHNIAYDNDKASSIKGGEITSYKSNIQDTLNSEKGICVDQAGLMLSILRSQGIQTKLCFGEVNYSKEYHSWVEVYLDNEWIIYDPTKEFIAPKNTTKDYSTDIYF